MRKVVIIGATSAIAEATARILAARGDALYLVARNQARVSGIASDLLVRGSSRVSSEVLDANDVAGHEAMLARAEAFLDGYDTVLIAHGTLSDQKACEASVDLDSAGNQHQRPFGGRAPDPQPTASRNSGPVRLR